jgi:hypothetical protein
MPVIYLKAGVYLNCKMSPFRNVRTTNQNTLLIGTQDMQTFLLEL